MKTRKDDIAGPDYLALLARWPESAVRDIRPFPGRPELEIYGTGYNHWGVQTNQKAFAAMAVLAAEPRLDENEAGISKEEILEHALKLLRFSLQSHIEGDCSCADGTKWGHTWISTLGIERMMHGIEAVRGNIGDADAALMKKVFISECDWLMDEYYRGKKTAVPGEIVAGKVTGNYPENNLWSGAFLHRTAVMFPDAPRAEEYRVKGTRFLVNSISVAPDSRSETLYDGAPVSEWYAGDNFFESFALNHHGYLNIGYMAICLSNIAMLHFSFRALGLAPPEALYHHSLDLWKLLKLCVANDGRLLRIGGDTRVRYCYCQDYLLPVLIFARDFFNDADCPKLEAEWLGQDGAEAEHNADGSFLSKRCARLREISPLYYTRLESDRAVSLSMGAYWRRILEIPSDTREHNLPELAGSWHDEYHGAYLERGRKRFASWVWSSAQPPQGLCVEPGGSSFAEWKQNLAGDIRGTGKLNYQEVASRGGNVFKNGFVTWGRTLFRSEIMVGEGQLGELLAVQHTAFAAVPDDQTVLVLQKARSGDNAVYIRSAKGIFLLIPNDIFNGSIRRYFSREGRLELRGCPDREETLKLRSRWLNIDDRISLMTGCPGEIFIHRPCAPQVGIKKFPAEENPLPGGMLYADEICSPCETGLRLLLPRTVVYDTGFAVKSGIDSKATESLQNSGGVRCFRKGGLRAVSVPCSDGAAYLLLANFGEERARLELDSAGEITSLSSGQTLRGSSSGPPAPELAPGTADLFRLG